MSFNYFETVDDLAGLADNVPGPVGWIAGTIGSVNDFRKQGWNRFAHPTVDERVQELIKVEEAQPEAPIQFDISYKAVDITLHLPDELPEDFDYKRYRLLQSNLLNVGSRRFVDNMFEANGVSGFDDMDQFKDNTAYAFNEDGFTFTDIDGITFVANEREHSISTQMMEFKGLTAKPMFEDLPESYVDELIPEGFDVDLDEIVDNPHLDDSINRNNDALRHFMEEFRDNLARGEVVEKDIEFVINTYPMRYSMNDRNNPELTRYEIPGGVKPIQRFMDDLDLITEDNKDKNHGSMSARDIVHSSVNYIGRGMEQVRGYSLRHDVQKISEMALKVRGPEVGKRKTYKELERSNLKVDGKVRQYYFENSHDGQNALNKAYGWHPDMVNMHVPMSNPNPMFTDEQIKESQMLNAEQMRQDSIKRGRENSSGLKELNAKFENQDKKLSMYKDSPELRGALLENDSHLSAHVDLEL